MLLSAVVMGCNSVSQVEVVEETPVVNVADTASDSLKIYVTGQGTSSIYRLIVGDSIVDTKAFYRGGETQGAYLTYYGAKPESFTLILNASNGLKDDIYEVWDESFGDVYTVEEDKRFYYVSRSDLKGWMWADREAQEIK